MSKPDYHSRLKNFAVLGNKFDKFLFNHGPTLITSEMCITTLIFFFGSKNPFGPRYTLTWFEMIFYIFALAILIIEIYVTRDFFENIPHTFAELLNRNVINGLSRNQATSKAFVSFLDEFESWLNNRVPFLLGGVSEIIVLVTLHISGLFPIAYFGHLPPDYPMITLLLNFITIFLPLTIAGYIVGLTFWKCFVAGYFVHKFSNSFNITVFSSHPDKAGGLRPIGDLIFSLALILIVASLALSVLVVANPINGSFYKLLIEKYSANLVLAPYYLYNTEQLSKIALGIIVILSFVSFLLPILSTHRQMRREKIYLQSTLSEIGIKIAELEKQAKKINITYTSRNDLFSEISSLTKIYEITEKTPVWPFDRDILIKFFTPQVISLLSLLGVVQPIIDAISSWVK
jgi:hypothetical protein